MKTVKMCLRLEITKVRLIQCNIVNNNYQLDSRVLYIFVPNKSFGQLLDISQKHFIFLKTFHLEFLYIEVDLDHAEQSATDAIKTS